MNIIVAADNNWAIGYMNRLLVSIPGDQRSFREMTTGKVVVYGRKTLHTFPGEAPLKNRTNIILTRDMNFRYPGTTVVHSLEELDGELKKYRSEDIYVIGGESVYRQLLDRCSTVHATRIDQEYSADAYFPDLDRDPQWRITAESEEQTCFDIEYRFVKYERV